MQKSRVARRRNANYQRSQSANPNTYQNDPFLKNPNKLPKNPTSAEKRVTTGVTDARPFHALIISTQ